MFCILSQKSIFMYAQLYMIHQITSRGLLNQKFRSGSLFPVCFTVTCLFKCKSFLNDGSAEYWNNLSFSVFQINGGRNDHESLLIVTELTINESRVARIQPFNQYRKKFHLKPYTSFHEFTGEQEQHRNYNLLLTEEKKALSSICLTHI